MNTLEEKLNNIKGIIFDLDGTLVSSRLDFAYLKRELECPTHLDLLVHVASLDEKKQAEAMAFIHNHEMQDAAQSSWLPGAHEFVVGCQQRDVPMAIITRNMRDAAMLKIEHNSIPIETLLTRDDAPPKPDPTGLLQVADEWQLANHAIMYIGDFLYDIEAALNAGMIACLYAPETRPDYADKAHITVQSFAELADLMHYRETTVGR